METGKFIFAAMVCASLAVSSVEAGPLKKIKNGVKNQVEKIKDNASPKKKKNQKNEEEPQEIKEQKPEVQEGGQETQEEKLEQESLIKEEQDLALAKTYASQERLDKYAELVNEAKDYYDKGDMKKARSSYWAAWTFSDKAKMKYWGIEALEGITDVDIKSAQEAEANGKRFSAIMNYFKIGVNTGKIYWRVQRSYNGVRYVYKCTITDISLPSDTLTKKLRYVADEYNRLWSDFIGVSINAQENPFALIDVFNAARAEFIEYWSKEECPFVNGGICEDGFKRTDIDMENRTATYTLETYLGEVSHYYYSFRYEIAKAAYYAIRNESGDVLTGLKDLNLIPDMMSLEPDWSKADDIKVSIGIKKDGKKQKLLETDPYAYGPYDFVGVPSETMGLLEKEKINLYYDIEFVNRGWPCDNVIIPDDDVRIPDDFTFPDSSGEK